METIIKISGADIDLNLLASLDALLTHVNVTNAAAQLEVSQSAMSYNLARLRKLLGDDLLTRASGGMRLTPYARGLIEPVGRILKDVNALITRSEVFVPEKASRSFRVGVPDSSELLLIPSVLARVRREAPGIQLAIRSVDRVNVLDELDAGTLDMALGIFSEGQVHHKRKLLHTDSYLCIFNNKLLKLKAPLSLTDFLSVPHVVTRSNVENDVIGEVLAKMGKTRSVALTTPHLLSVAFMVKGAPVLATVHSKLAHYFAKTLALSISPAPIALPDVPISMLWHTSNDKDNAHKWLRRLIAEVMIGVEAANKIID